jgi:hypothetical protein
MCWNTTGLNHSNAIHLIGLFETGFNIVNTDHDGSRSNDPVLYPEGLQFDSLAGQRVSLSFLALLSPLQWQCGASDQITVTSWHLAKFQVLTAVLFKTRILWDVTAETHSVTSPKIWASFHIISNSFQTDYSINQGCSVRATNSAFKLLINTAEPIW